LQYLALCYYAINNRHCNREQIVTKENLTLNY
jgi:hypothetical protein